MKRWFFVRRLSIAVITFCVAPSLAAAQPAVGSYFELPSVPPELEVPAGHRLFLAGYAEGTQNYMCLPASTGVAWRPTGPQATLFRVTNGEPQQQLTTHFLSVNPADGVARPTWQHSRDTSRVWGRVVAASSDANYVEPGAVPWLLLEAAGTARGPIGSAVLADTSYIQRLNTSGGIAPSSGCGQTADVGAVAMVPYHTAYFFYRPARGR
jgi:hypothetical protein